MPPQPPIGMLMNMGFGSEVIYSFVIIICSLMIYIGTRELYMLSSYKGIKYFRQAFLFFALAYFFRSFIKFALIYFDVGQIMDFSPRVFGPVTLFIFMYFSSMAIFYLLYSVMWKRLEGKFKKIYLFHLLAIIISSVSILSRSPIVNFGLNLFLLLFVILIVYTAYINTKNKTKGYNLYTIYILLTVFWILNIIDILMPKFLSTFQLIIYLTSSGIFLLILYKVLRKTGN
jgi:hypothetical protein